MDVLQAIIKNSAFWAAIVILLNSLADYFIPEFPRDIRAALTGVLSIIFAAIAGVQITNVVRTERKAKAEREALEAALSAAKLDRVPNQADTSRPTK